MSNILGEHFQDWVTDQITTRQKALGYRTDVTDDTLKYINTKTPWLRLASSVDLTKVDEDGGKLHDSVLERLTKRGVNERLIAEDNLAKNFILQGSVSSLDHKNRYEGVKFGLNTVDSLFGGLYGWGGMEERGYVPPPGITQASVQHQNNGSLTKTIVNIKCFSRAQFQLLDALYLRPGYTLLLEWGWSQYLDNDNKLKEFGPFKTTPLKKLFNTEDVDHFDMYKAIDKDTEEYDGNYGAIYGKVCNFSWKFNKDGSYDVSVQITGIGDVIESLKSNVTKTDEAESCEVDSGVDTGKEEDKCLLHQELSSLFYWSSPSNPTGGAVSCSEAADSKFYYSDLKFEHFPSIKDLEYEELDKIEINGGLFSITEGVVKGGEKDKVNRIMYLTFGTLLAIIQKKLLLYNKGVPLTGFDVNFENLLQDENYIITFPGHFSSNPNICLIPYTNSNLDLQLNQKYSGQNIKDFDINKKLTEGDNFHIDGNPYLGRLMNIYINRDYIVEIMDNIAAEDGSVSIIDLLQSILSGVSLSLGGINKLSIKETRNGLIKFWEESPQQIANISKEDRKLAKFNVFGVKPGIEGSFIRNVGLNSEIPKDFTAMITIGAQVQGNQPSENSVSFSNYNAGLKDRVVDERTSTGALGENTPSDNIQKIWNEKIVPLVSSEVSTYGLWSAPAYMSPFPRIYNDLQFLPDNISKLTNYNSEYSKLVVGVLSTIGPDQQIPPNFFLPFYIDLEMDGLTGMVMYQKFKISDNILPPSYDENKIDLLITSLNHTINPQSWTTTVKALSSPTPPDLNVLSSPVSSQNEEKDKCGEKELDIATINPPRGVDTPFSLNAMEKSFTGFFSENEEKKKKCAQYSYNLAFNYTNFLKNSLSPLSQLIIEKGHTNDPVFHQNIKDLGYEMEKVGTNINKGDIWNIFNKVSFGIGDIVIYWANTGDPSSSAREYGHTQIYVGGITPSGWASSYKNNYGTSFVYSGTKVTESECWDMLIFRSPRPPSLGASPIFTNIPSPI